MSFASETRERSRPVLPLAAMVDVLFLLLIFFMTTSVFNEQEMAMPVDLAVSESAEGSTAGTQTVVNVTVDNKIYLGEREVDERDLRDTFAELVSMNPNERLLVRGDRGSDLGVAVRVLDLAQQAGIEEVSISTVRPAGE